MQIICSFHQPVVSGTPFLFSDVGGFTICKADELADNRGSSVRSDPTIPNKVEYMNSGFASVVRYLDKKRGRLVQECGFAIFRHQQFSVFIEFTHDSRIVQSVPLFLDAC